MKQYSVEFRVDNSGQSESGFNGFENVKTAGYFEAGWNMNLLFHDIFEHWFEDSKYFKTSQLSQAGECVAMGIRSYFLDYSCLVNKFASFNKFHGPEWNSWSTCISQVQETRNGDNDKYPNDFKYSYLPEWEPENINKGYVDSYGGENLPKKLKKQIETAFSYGYWLGQKMFDGKLDMIYNFCTNLNIFLKELELDNLSMDDSTYLPIGGYYLNVDVRTDNIVAEFAGIKITANQSEATAHKAVKAILNKFEYSYY